MSNSSRTTDDAEQRTHTPLEWPLLNGQSQELGLEIVDVDGRPDRATIFPVDSTNLTRMETWISVDAAIVRELSAWR